MDKKSDISKLISFGFVSPIFIALIVIMFGYERPLIIVGSTIALQFCLIKIHYNGCLDRYANLLFLMMFCVYFDSEPFLFFSFNIRIYQVVMVITFPLIISRFIKLRFSVLSIFIILYMLIVVIAQIFTREGVLDAIKYTLFYVLFVVFIVILYSESKANLQTSIEIFTYGTISFVIFGLIQFIYSLQYGFHINPLLPPVYNLELRPVAFFSETTWLSELTLFTIIGACFVKRGLVKVVMFLVCLSVILITVTRNTYLAGFACVLCFCFFNFLRMSVNKKVLGYSIFLTLAAFIVTLVNEDAYNLMLNLISRFVDLDSGGNGRIDAFLKAYSMLKSNSAWLFGNGFYWNPDVVAGQGSSLGAKAFNSIIMLLHIYGPVLLVAIVIYIVSKIVFCYTYGVKGDFSTVIIYYLMFLISFCSISMFAPIHQYPMGAMLLGIALGGIRKIKRHRYVQ